MAYLAAAENVSQTTDPDGTTHFTFDINGAKLADYVRREMQTALDTNHASGGATATLTLPYPVVDGSDSVSTQMNVTADADNPVITIDASADGALLDNGATDYVIGGSARDESSWIDRVEIDLPAGAGTVTTDKNNPWAYTWHLPADGDYNITARAFDFVGHTATDSVNVQVDNTPPTADTDLPAHTPSP